MPTYLPEVGLSFCVEERPKETAPCTFLAGIGDDEDEKKSVILRCDKIAEEHAPTASSAQIDFVMAASASSCTDCKADS